MSGLPLTISEAAERLRRREISSRELTRAMLERSRRLDPEIGAYIHCRNEAALADAERADADFAAGVDRGPLQGIPLCVKDILATRDCPTTAQSRILDSAWGNQGDAPSVARLRSAGAVFTGKTTTMEFAIGLPDPDQPFPVPRNPWDTSKWAGGSSSGTASGVAAGFFLGGLGTDTGGSIRMPSAYCGLTGLKATFGRVPKSRCVPLAWSLDHVGPMARSARDCAILLQALAGHDPSDPLCANAPVPDYVAALDGSVAGLRIGVEREHHTRLATVDPAAVDRLESALRVFADGGAEIVEVSIPHVDELMASCTIALFSEALAYHRRDLGERWREYGRHTRVMLGLGALFGGSDYVEAGRVIAACRDAVGSIFRTVDLIATPTAGVGAPPLAGLDLLAALSLPVFTAIWNALRFPAMSVPMGFTDSGLPLGLQLAGRMFDEATVLRAGDAYQRRTDWHLRIPPMVV